VNIIFKSRYMLIVKDICY